jgi:hypothetical protein
MRFSYLLAFFCLLAFGCQKKNEDYFLRKGEVIQQEIVEQLMDVQTLQDLLPKEEALTQLFLELSSLAIRADQWRRQHKCKKDPSSDEIPSEQLLEQEFRRVLAIPGAESLLERCQKQALDKLDVYLGACR